MAHATDSFRPGQQVVVTQQIPQTRRVWTTQTAGAVVRYEQRKTGSWFAHAKDDRLWLDRLVVRKADGEIVVFNLDQYTHVEVTADAPAGESGDAASTAADPAEAASD